MQQLGVSVGQSSSVVQTVVRHSRPHAIAYGSSQHSAPLAQSSRPSQYMFVPGHAAAASMQRAGFDMSAQHFWLTEHRPVSHTTPL